MEKVNITPLVSVVMPVLNGQEFLAAAIESILNQTYSDFEFLIIDDGSTDRTADIIMSYKLKDPRIRIVVHSANCGIVASLNEGVFLARGKYIARMDADDISRSDRFEKQVAYLERHPEIGVCGSWIQYIGNREGVEKHPLDHETIIATLVRYNCISHPAVMMRRSLFSEKSYFYEDVFKYAEDYYLWGRLMFVTRFENLPETLLQYRVQDGRIGNKYRDFQEHSVNKLRMAILDKLGSFVWEDGYGGEVIQRLLLGNANRLSLAQLPAAFVWFKNLKMANAEKKIFPEPAFSEMLSDWRINFMETAYFLRGNYNLTLLFQFIKDKEKPVCYVGKIKLFRFALKCLICWQVDSKFLSA